MPGDPRDTPAMRQYYRFKKQHPQCVLLFRIGDFYEMFDDDAVAVSRAIGLTLTRRTEGVPMCGLPYHQLEGYLRRLIAAGFRVAVCEQTQDAKDAKGVIERAVTRVLTPGTLVDDALLDESAQRTLAALCFLDPGDEPGARAAAAVADLSTGRFSVFLARLGGHPSTSNDALHHDLIDELTRLGVTELLYAATTDTASPTSPPPRIASVLARLAIAGTAQPPWHFRHDEAAEALRTQFGVATFAGFGLSDDDPCLRPAGAIVRYLLQTQAAGPPDTGHPEGILPTSAAPPPTASAKAHLRHLQPPRRDDPAGLCTLDAVTLRALEVLATIRPPAPTSTPGAAPTLDGSLAGIFASTRAFPGCRTPMGKRLLREWLCRPLADLSAITGRQRRVAVLVEDRRTAAALADALTGVQDAARIAARLALGRASPRDLVALGATLARARAVANAIDLAPAFAQPLAALRALEDSLQPLAERIGAACVDAPPAAIRDGGLIRPGVDPELDDARALQHDAGQWMAQYQARLIAEHALPSLKVGYNQVFGYYIELPAAQARRAPDAFTRKQTLKNAERYITPELKQFEDKVSTAQARALAREVALFQDLCEAAAAVLAPIAAFADTLAELDAIQCFADKAARRRWMCPELTDHPTLVIHQGRHPVLDELLEAGAHAGGTSGFVPNDTELNAPSGDSGSPGPSLALITGPNMAGKSTYIRQAALLVLLAHAGSFIPADRAVIGLTDRIFTRIGADDALHAGQSTFMVEMTETARILHHATPRSLVILDEIGRGTSTLDGLSLAWAIAETLAGALPSPHPHSAHPLRGPRTLFATHYHELTDLQDRLPDRVANLHVAVREWGDDVVFLHRILPGRAGQSYGLHVAKLAGLLPATLARARQILATLAVHHHAADTPPVPPASPAATLNGQQRGQLGLFTEFLTHPAIDALKEVKLDALSPLEAFDTLRRLTDLARQP